MNAVRLTLFFSIALLNLAASPGQTLNSIGDFYPTDLSGDGSITLGRDPAFGGGPVRWENDVLNGHGQGSMISTNGVVVFGKKGEKGYRWANKLVLTLTDGGLGDKNGETDGRIHADLGPATSLPPLPEMKLSLTWQEESRTLSWSNRSDNFLLELSPGLSPASWWNLNSLLLLEHGYWRLTPLNPLAGENEPNFYRLRHAA